jgi:hypothetical protein
MKAARFQRVAQLPFRKLDHEVVVVDPRQRRIHVLNGTASVLWDLLERARSLPDLVTAVIGEEPFDVGGEVVARDVSAFIAEMVEKGLVSAFEPAAPGTAR